MKIIYLLIASWFISSPLDQANVTVDEFTPILIETTVSGVGFGKKKKGCEGKGVCIITNDFKAFTIDDRHTIAEMTYSSGELESILFRFDKLTDQAIKTFFSGKYFIMEEAYEGSLRNQRSSYKIYLPEGKYPIRRTKEGFLLEVTG